MAKTTDVAPKLLLIDGLSLAYRAFYALPTDLATPNGTVTNAVYGFTSMLVKVLTDEHPDEIVVVFDAPGRTFRDDLDDDVQVRPQGNARPVRAADPADPRSDRRAAHSHAADRGRRGRRRDRHARHPRRRRRQRRRRRHRRSRRLPTRRRPAHQGALQPSRRLRLRALRRSRHRRAHRGHRRASTRSTPRSAATRATTCRASRASARRRRPSSSPPTATSRGSSPTSTSSPRSNARTWATRATGCSSTVRCRCWSATSRSTSIPASSARAQWDRDEVQVLFDQLAFRTLMPRLLEGLGETSAAAAVAEADVLDVEVDVMRDAAAVLERFGELTSSNEPFALEPRWDGAPVTSALRGDRARARRTRRVHRRRTAARPGGPRGARRARWRRAGRRWSRTARRS